MLENHDSALGATVAKPTSAAEEFRHVRGDEEGPNPNHPGSSVLANGISWSGQTPQVETPKQNAPNDYLTIVINGSTQKPSEREAQQFAENEKLNSVGNLANKKSASDSYSPLEIGNAVIAILERYRQVPKAKAQQPWQAKHRFLELIQEHVQRGEPIPMVLPAFPFKSPNKIYKVLGHLPDKAEEIAIMHLDGLCKEIGKVYQNGARVDIVSDGLMYNDVLGISDKEVWTYGQALRKLAVDKGCDRIHFVRLVHLLGEAEIGEPLTEEEYLRDASWFRSQLYQRNIPEGFDPSKHIASDHDTTLTYRGYIKFLEKDIDDGRFENTTLSKKQMKKIREEIAKKMIARGRAFAIAIANNFEKSVRLSIHPSADTKKLSISLIPQNGGTVMTPWHSCLVQSVNGSVELKHAGAVSEQTHELIYENGRPSYYRERSSLFDWGGADVDFQFQYPTGMLVSTSAPYVPLCASKLQKAILLAQKCSPVTLKGFSATEQELAQDDRTKSDRDSSEESIGTLVKSDGSLVSDERELKPVQARIKASQSLRSRWKRVWGWSHGYTTV